MVPIVLEDLGSGLDDIVISQWYVTEGDVIDIGIEVAEVLTNKASINVTSSVSGKVVELLHNQGDRVMVGDALVMVEEEELELMDEGVRNA